MKWRKQEKAEKREQAKTTRYRSEWTERREKTGSRRGSIVVCVLYSVVFAYGGKNISCWLLS